MSQARIAFTDWAEVPIVVSMSEAARVLGISRGSLYALLRRDEILTKQVGGRRLITKAELQRFVEEVA